MVRRIYSSVRVDPYADSLGSVPVVNEARVYRPYNGLTIDTVVVERYNIFGRTHNFVERWTNRLHVTTREKTISRDLMFGPGSVADADLLARNLYLLRSRSYLSSADIDAAVPVSDSSRVELRLRTRDKWTIGMDAYMSFNDNSTLLLFDDNVLGTGNRLSVATNFNLERRKYGGNTVTLSTPNLSGTFLGSTVTVGKDFDYSYMSYRLAREFLNPTDYGGGLYLSRERAPYELLRFRDSTCRVVSWGWDAWVGASRWFDGIDGSLYAALRYFDWRFEERPDVGPGLNPAYHDSRGFLASAGVHKERYLGANMVYGYGIKEVLPAGYKVEATVGYAVGEFWNSMYLGAQYKIGGVVGEGHYLMGEMSLGGRIRNGRAQWQQGAFNARILWFSPLRSVGMSDVRQFVTLDYTRGIKRLEGNNELVRFTHEARPRGFTEHVAGLNRAVLNAETVVFTPWVPAGFRTVLFGYADAGLIGDRANIFDNNIYATFGVGARFKNELLIFQAIQIRLGIAVARRGYVDSRVFELGSRRALDHATYRPTQPDYVGYR